MPLTIVIVQEMAGLLVTQYEKSGYIGQTWVRDFLKRHDTLKLKYNYKYDY